MSPKSINADQLIVWCLTLFSTVFQLYRGGQCTYPCFPGALLTSTLHNIFSKTMAAFTHNHCRNNRNGERGINPVTMTIINPRKEYWLSRGSNQRPVLRSTTLPTLLLLWGSALSKRRHKKKLILGNKRAIMALDRSPESFSLQMNCTSLFLWFKFCDPQVGPVLIPRGII